MCRVPQSRASGAGPRGSGWLCALAVPPALPDTAAHLEGSRGPVNSTWLQILPTWACFTLVLSSSEDGDSSIRHVAHASTEPGLAPSRPSGRVQTLGTPQLDLVALLGSWIPLRSLLCVCRPGLQTLADLGCSWLSGARWAGSGRRAHPRGYWSCECPVPFSSGPKFGEHQDRPCTGKLLTEVPLQCH